MEDDNKCAASTHLEETSSEPHDNAKHLLRRIDFRMLPLCGWVYLLNYLDRSNIGNSRLLNKETGDSLMQRTHMTPTQYAIMVSMFSVAYCIFEVPSNWIMKKYFRPSRWLAFLLFSWGAFTLGFAGVKNFGTALALRILIGVAEAGFFPGIVLLITYWYRVEERSIRIAVILASATLAGAFGGCIAYGVGHMNGIAGLEGFRWLFIIEGTITVLSIMLLILFLPDYPSAAKWLTTEQKHFAEARLQGQGGGSARADISGSEIVRAALRPRMLAHYAAYFTNCVPLGSLTFMTPTIVSGLGYTSIEAQLMTVPPWVVAYVVSLCLAFSADRFNARGLHVAGATIVGGVGWLTAGLLPAKSYHARYGSLILAACGAFPSAAPLSNWVTSNTTTLGALAITIAMNNSMGGLAQLVSQWIFRSSEASQGYPTGNFVCAACSLATSALVIGLRLTYGYMNRRTNIPPSEGERRIYYY